MAKERWISSAQLRHSLWALRHVHPYFGMTFLAFKEYGVPVDSQMLLNFSAVMRQFLEEYYKPTRSYSGYYSPFRTSNPSNRWLTSKYPNGSLQRITVDTFGDAIIHTKRRPLWGWRKDYVKILAELQDATDTAPIPAFHLAVWLYRNRPGLGLETLTPTLLTEFGITDEERKLFDLRMPGGPFEEEMASAKISERSLFRIIGWPPGGSQNESMAVSRLEIREVGPATKLVYEPSKRLNLITGDNSVGKTFLLDSIWWTLTGKWLEYPAVPRRNVKRTAPALRATFKTPVRHIRQLSKYNWDRQIWQVPKRAGGVGALSIYARHDGSFVVWDTVSSLDGDGGLPHVDHVVLDRDSLWYGKRIVDDQRGVTSICNGLLLDWVNWQARPSRFGEVFGAFARCLAVLSPPGGQRLLVDEPIFMAGDEQEIPALAMEYGTLPVVHASAGVKRVLGMAYVLIWAWFRHQRNARLAGREPFDQLILLVDEVEAHLHPRWQRAIVPALMEVVQILSDELEVQAHVASHSPLILASAETVFDKERDSLHQLEIANESVSVSSVNFVNFGNVDAWLVSDVFGLKHARSLDAERLIEKAKSIQLAPTPNVAEVLKIDKGLRRCLRDDDEFWPRWRYFAQTVSIEDDR